MTGGNLAGIRGDKSWRFDGGEDKMQCHRQIEELLYEVSILSDSLLAQSDCQASYCQNVRYRDCAPVQIVKLS